MRVRPSLTCHSISVNLFCCFTAFLISLDSSSPFCLQAYENNTVMMAWHCSTWYAPYFNKFQWKWHRKYNLINIDTGLCLAKDNQVSGHTFN